MVKNMTKNEVTKGAKEKIMEFYEKHFVVIWIIFVGIILILNFYLQEKFPSDKNLTVYFQTIFLGFITFSIPFLWNLYQKILEVKSKSVGYSIENIINKDLYKRADRLFVYYLLFPYIFFLLGGLVFSFCFSSILLYFFIFTSFCLILFSTKIYHWIEGNSDISSPMDKQLKNFISLTPINDDLMRLLNQLFQKTDGEIEKQYFLNSSEWLDLFTCRIEKIIEQGPVDKQNGEFLYNILTFFHDSLENRDLLALLRSSIFEKFLKFHLTLWKKGQGKEDREEYIFVLSVFERTISKIFTKSFEEQEGKYFIFFLSDFIKHINNSLEEKIEINGEKKLYVKDILSLTNFCNILFNRVPYHPSHLEVWRSIPYEWRISSQNLKKGIVPRILLNKFLIWAQLRIIQGKEKEWDECLDEVSAELFPETDPKLWAYILTFAFAPYVPLKKVESFMEWPIIFGYTTERFSDILKNAEWTTDINLEEEYQQEKKKTMEQVEKTIKLLRTIRNVYVLFRDTFSQENIEKYLEEIRTIEDKYKDDKEKCHKLQRLKSVFEKLKEQ